MSPTFDSCTFSVVFPASNTGVNGRTDEVREGVINHTTATNNTVSGVSPPSSQTYAGVLRAQNHHQGDTLSRIRNLGTMGMGFPLSYRPARPPF